MKKVLIVEEDPVRAKINRHYLSEAGAESRILIATVQALEKI